MRGIARNQVATFVGAAWLACFCLPPQAPAQNAVSQRIVSKTGKADHEIPLSGHVSIDASCTGIGVPTIDLDEPPAHGIVCSRPGDVLLSYLVNRTPARCVGETALGVRVVYLPLHGYAGKDKARYTARFPYGQVKVDADVTIVPDDRPSIGAVPTDISAPAGDTPQLPGPIPACAALAS